MRLVFIHWLFFSFLALTIPWAWASTPPEGRWEPIAEVWDEFSGPRLDTAKWDNRNLYYKGKKPGLFMPHNIQLDNGELHIWARAENMPGRPPGYHSFTTAAITSTNPVKYGYFEIRAKVMRSSIINAFWLYRWTENGTYEIDILEVSGGGPKHERTIHTNAHVYRGPPELENDRNRISDSFDWKTPAPLADQYHVYGFEWDEKVLKWYFDDKLIRTKANEHWHIPMSIKFSTETHPDWVGLPGEGELPAVFRVDYFRAWRKTVDITLRKH